MIKHIVTWKLSDDNKENNKILIKNKLLNLKNFINELKSIEVGINENGGDYDVILITTFESYDDLKIYDTHPEHVKVKDFIKTVVTSRIAVDYSI